MKLSEKIEKIRKEKGETLYSLQEKTGIWYSSIGNVTKGKVRKPSIEVVSKLATALDITVDELIQGTEFDYRKEE